MRSSIFWSGSPSLSDSQGKFFESSGATSIIGEPTHARPDLLGQWSSRCDRL